jgi:hypothetical protein
MMGVHGNGLTSLVWMKPTPRATVIEFLYPGGFAYDYEYTTRALGMVHYGVWGDKCVPFRSSRHAPLILVFAGPLQTQTSPLPHTPKVSRVTVYQWMEKLSLVFA